MIRYLFFITRYFLLAMIVLMASLAVAEVVDPAEQFLLAYQNFQQGERLEREGNLSEAVEKYHFAENVLVDLQANYPNWQQAVVDYRLHKVRDDLERIGSSASVPTRNHVESTEQGDVDSSGTQETRGSRENSSLQSSDSSVRSSDQTTDNPSISIIPPEGKRGPSDQEMLRLQKQLKKAELELQQARSDVANKTTELDGKKVLLVDMKSQLENAQRQVTDLKSDLAKTRSGSTQREAFLKKSLQDLQGKVMALSADQEVMAEENSVLQQRLKQSTDSLAAGLGNKNRLEQLQLEVNSEKNAAAALHEKLNAAERERDAVSSRNQELQQQLEVANAALPVAQKQTQELESLRGQVSKLTTENNDKANALTAIQNQTKNFEETQKKLETEFEKKLAAAQTAQENLAEEKKALEVALKKVMEQATVSEQSVANVSVERQQAALVAQQLQDANKRLADAETARASLEKSQQQSLADVNNKLQAAVRDQQTAEAKKAELEKQLLEANEKMKSLQAGTAAASSMQGQELKSLHDQIMKLTEENSEQTKELVLAQSQSKDLEEARKNMAAEYEKKLTATQSGEASIDEEKKTLQAKLKKAADEIEVLQKIGADAASLREQVTTANQQLETTTKRLADAEAARSALEKIQQQSVVDFQNKLQAAQSDRQVLEAKKTELEKQLAEMGEKMKAAAQTGSNAEAMNASIAEYKTELQQGAAKLVEAEKKIAELEKAGPEKDRLLQQKEKELADARQESDKLQKELLATNQKLTSLQQEVQVKDDRYNELKKTLDQKSEELLELKKKQEHREVDQKVIDENELLKGIVLRELKAEAKRQQTKKLITEDLEKLKINSDTLSDELKKLARPVKLTPEEKALFKDQITALALPSAEEEPDDKLMMEVAAGKKDSGTTNGEAASNVAVKTTNQLVSTNSSVSNSSTNTIVEKNKKEDDARHHYQEIVAKAKDQFEHQNYSEAEKSFQDAIAISPDDYLTLSNLGVVEFQLGKMSEAEAVLKKACAVDHKKSFALTTLGIVHYRQERLDDAEKVLRQALAVNDQDFTAHNYLGIVLSASGKSKAGESELMKALEINPQYADAHFNLAVIYATGKPPAKELAKSHYEKAKALGAPPDPSLEKLL